MRTYKQYCAVARALDVIGDRWTLLIVRELLVRGACRYTDLQFGLPGIATNLLADRLRELEEHGIIVREAAPPPIATTLFRLTQRGEELEDVLQALGRWGGPFMQGPAGDAEFRSHWLKFPLERYLSDHSPDRPAATIQIDTADQPMLVEVAEGRVRIRPGTVSSPEASLKGPPSVVISFLTGKLDLRTARERGLAVEGDLETLRRVQPLVSSTDVVEPTKRKRPTRIH